MNFKNLFASLIVAATSLFVGCGIDSFKSEPKTAIEYAEDIKEKQEEAIKQTVNNEEALRSALAQWRLSAQNGADNKTLAKDWKEAWNEFEANLAEQKNLADEMESELQKLFAVMDSSIAKMNNGGLKTRQYNQLEAIKKEFGAKKAQFDSLHNKINSVLKSSSDFEIALNNNAAFTLLSEKLKVYDQITATTEKLFVEVNQFNKDSEKTLGITGEIAAAT
jgi:hypothetical protein